MIGLSLEFYRLRKWHKYPGPITEQSKAKTMQSRTTQLKLLQ